MAKADFSTAAASAPPSVEMTRLGLLGERTSNDSAKTKADFSTAAAQSAAFGRNDGVWAWGENKARRNQAER